MTAHQRNLLAALVNALLEVHAPALMAALDADPRATRDPGILAAHGRLKGWLEALRSRRRRRQALAPDRLATALRAAFVCVVGRSSIEVSLDPRDAGARMRIKPEEFALIGHLRDIAALLDGEQGSTVAEDFDTYREGLFDRAFALANAAAMRAAAVRS